MIGQKDFQIHTVLLHHQSSIWSSLSKASLSILESAVVILLVTMLMMSLAFSQKLYPTFRGMAMCKGMPGHAQIQGHCVLGLYQS